jgi:hypothetical protein
MSDDSQGKEKIKELFRILNITKMVYVDDYNLEITAGTVIASPKRNTILKDIFPELLLIGDEDIENEELRKQWEDISYEKIIKIKKIITADENSSSPIDDKAIPAFAELIPDELVIPLSPEGWEQRKEELLLNSKTTLFLFDQDLKRNGRENDGIEIIKNISKNNEIICGLFTQKAKKNECFIHRDKMCEEYNIEKDNFFIIPKEEVNNNLLLFVYLLKLAILGRDFVKFRTCTNNILDKVNKNIKGKIEKIWIEDFDHIMFHVPWKEGLWEPDMFFRIYSCFQRQNFIELACSDDKLRSSISKIRSVSSISTKPEESIIPSNAWKIQQNEMYDDAEHLNNNHLPIEVGDIFEETNNNKKYILLTQPCDLMVRSKGERSRQDRRFALIEMKKMEEKIKNNKFIQEIWYYGTSEKEKWIINYKDVFLVKDYILDLCIYNDAGISRYVSTEKIDSNNIRPSLINRYSEIEKQINKKGEECNNIYEEVKKGEKLDFELIKKNIYETVFQDDLFKPQYECENDSLMLTFNCRRIGRLTYERAIGLLAEFCSIMQRPGYSTEYGKE